MRIRVMERRYYMLYTRDEHHSANDVNNKTIQKGMPMRAGNKPQQKESCYERNENDIITRLMINMIMDTGQTGREGRRGKRGTVLLITMKPQNCTSWNFAKSW